MTYEPGRSRLDEVEEPEMIDVMVVDDEPLIRDGFRMLIEQQDDMRVVGEAGTGVDAVRVALDVRPDVLLMDIRMPGGDGIQATERIVADLDSTKVIVLTTFDQDEYIEAALQVGASGFLLKRLAREDLLRSIRVVAAGDALLAPSITRRVISRLTSSSRNEGPQVDVVGTYRLTAREVDIFKLLATGLSTADIAAELGIRQATVKSHVSNLLVKTGCRGRVEAVILAYNCGVVSPDVAESSAGNFRSASFVG